MKIEFQSWVKDIESICEKMIDRMNHNIKTEDIVYNALDYVPTSLRENKVRDLLTEINMLLLIRGQTKFSRQMIQSSLPVLPVLIYTYLINYTSQWNTPAYVDISNAVTGLSFNLEQEKTFSRNHRENAIKRLIPQKWDRKILNTNRRKLYPKIVFRHYFRLFLFLEILVYFAEKYTECDMLLCILLFNSYTGYLKLIFSQDAYKDFLRNCHVESKMKSQKVYSELKIILEKWFYCIDDSGLNMIFERFYSSMAIYIQEKDNAHKLTENNLIHKANVFQHTGMSLSDFFDEESLPFLDD